MRIWCTTAPSALPPTKAMGAITQSCQGLPTATPLSTLWYSGVVRFQQAMERRHCLMGCIFWAKFSRRGGLIPWLNRNGRTELDRLSQSKKSTIPQSTVGGLFMFGESAMGQNGSHLRKWGCPLSSSATWSSGAAHQLLPKLLRGQTERIGLSL